VNERPAAALVRPAAPLRPRPSYCPKVSPVCCVPGLISMAVRALLVGGASAAAAATLMILQSRKKKPSFTLGYWDIRGLAAPARMMLVYAGAEFEDKMFELKQKEEGNGWDAEEWFDECRPALRQKNAFINLPYLIDEGTGLVVTQSTAIYQYLGRKLELMGSSEAEEAAAEQTLAQAFDLRNELVRIVYPFSGTTPEKFPGALTKHMKSISSSHYDKFSRFLGDKPFFAGQSPTAGDFHVWEMLDQHELMATQFGKSSPLEEYPALRAFHKRMRQLPRLAPYFESEAARLPCNNRMANFK